MVGFRDSWWGTGLGEHRPVAGTYHAFAADTLPPLPGHQLTGDFRWLRSARPGRHHIGTVRRTVRGALLTAAERAGVRLPESFVRFLGEVRWQKSVPTCTDCFLDVSRTPIPSPFEPDAYLVRFLRDSQDCLLWYLYCTADEAYVVATTLYFDEQDEGDPDPARVTRCAGSFEEFLYRFWAENTLWYHLHDEDTTDLSPELAGYLGHYRG